MFSKSKSIDENVYLPKACNWQLCQLLLCGIHLEFTGYQVSPASKISEHQLVVHTFGKHKYFVLMNVKKLYSDI